jgi:hypothetical protein
MVFSKSIKQVADGRFYCIWGALVGPTDGQWSNVIPSRAAASSAVTKMTGFCRDANDVPGGQHPAKGRHFPSKQQEHSVCRPACRSILKASAFVMPATFQSDGHLGSPTRQMSFTAG